MNKKNVLLVLLIIISVLFFACENQTDLIELRGHVNIKNQVSTIEADFFESKADINQDLPLLEQEATLNHEEIIIEFKEGLEQQEKDDFKQEYSLSKIREISALDLKLYQVEKNLSEADFIEWIEELNQKRIITSATSNYYLNLEAEFGLDTEVSAYQNQWNHSLISLPLLWESNTGCEDITVAVLDTGIDASHPAFKDQLVPGKSYIEPESEDGDFEIGYIDDHGHGTHVAGIVGAANNGEMRGVSWDSKLMPVKVLDARGGGTIADIIDGIRWAAEQGVEVINLSLGSTLGLGDKNYEAAIDYASEQGSIVVSSSGNSNDTKVGHPARYKNAIAVGASNQENQRWAAGSNGSNYGRELDIMAPGEDIYSTLPGDRVDYLTGTSMAAPHISGVIALMLAENPELQADEIRERLTMSAQDLGQAGRDLEYGYGLVNAHAAVYGAQRNQVKLFLGERKNNFFHVEKGPINPNQDGFFEFDVESGEAYALYAWFDVTDSGTIQTGDYFASVDLALGGSFNYNLELEVLDEGFNEIIIID